ncbi:MAG: aldo/keto reductase [Aerococcus sp.]|nr:aldo/keto reductase [Aerococcus sp.]
MTEVYTLANGHTIPKLGFGTWELKDGDEAYNAVRYALDAGLRHIDTAQAYKNEASVGKAIAESGIEREEIFLTTKIWNDKGTYEDALQSIEDSLNRLQTDYVDLLLIHWPNPAKFRENPGFEERNAAVWRAMEETYHKGQARSIGISNFRKNHIDALLKTATVMPVVNQIKLTPGLTQDDIVAASRAHDMILEAYSPLGSGEIFKNPVVIDMAEKYGKTVAQVALRWSIEHGFVPLGRSRSREHIESNAQIFDFSLAAEDIETLDQLEGMSRDHNPDEANF